MDASFYATRMMSLVQVMHDGLADMAKGKPADFEWPAAIAVENARGERDVRLDVWVNADEQERIQVREWPAWVDEHDADIVVIALNVWVSDRASSALVAGDPDELRVLPALQEDRVEVVQFFALAPLGRVALVVFPIERHPGAAPTLGTGQFKFIDLALIAHVGDDWVGRIHDGVRLRGAS